MLLTVSIAFAGTAAVAAACVAAAMLIGPPRRPWDGAVGSAVRRPVPLPRAGEGAGGETPGQATRIAGRQDSLLQSRGVIFFSAAYLVALSSTILRIISRS